MSTTTIIFYYYCCWYYYYYLSLTYSNKTEDYNWFVLPDAKILNPKGLHKIDFQGGVESKVNHILH